MPIRLSKSGSTLRLGATALVASASLWFGSAVYAQTQPAPQMGTFPLSSQTQSAYAQQPLSHSQARRVTTERLPSNTNFDFNSGRFLSPTVAPVTPAAQRAPRTTERLDAGNLSNQAVLNMLGQQARSNVQTVPTHVTVPVQSTGTNQAWSQPSSQTVTTAYHSAPAVAANSGVHQLSSISMTQFEQKLLDRFGGHLKATTSEDGRYVRVLIPVLPVQNAAVKPVTMLVDRKTGKLEYEGAAGMKAQWHQLISAMDSAEPASQVAHAPVAQPQVAHAPVVRPKFEAPVVAPQVQQVAYQQDDGTPLNLGPQIQSQLSGPVLIGRDEQGNLTLTGDPKDVAIVRREIDRLSKQAEKGQPQVESIPLTNVRGNLIQERVQEIYDSIFATSNGAANITATDSPNALVVIGSPKAIQAVKKLVSSLDLPTVPGSVKEFRTFGLRYISSNDAANRLRRFFGQEIDCRRGLANPADTG